METDTDRLMEKVHDLPDAPGVYLFQDARGQVLYIGKALSLRKRVSSYFSEGRSRGYDQGRIAAMVSQIADLEFILTDSELEALILESNLVKEHKPRYNIVLKDDKHYPFLKLDITDPWPWLQVVRRVKNDGALYFGPYVPAGAMWKTLAFLNKTFPLRKCRSVQGRTLCLEYHLGRCLGPCEGLVSPEEYAQLVGQVRLVLEGKDGEVVRRLTEKMEKAAEALEFEKAAAVRDQIAALKQATEGRRILSAKGEDQDVVGLAQDGAETVVHLFFVRQGRLIGRESFSFELPEEPGHLLASLLTQFYLRRQDLPSEVLLSHTLEDAPLIAEWLSKRAGRRVSLLTPQRGRKADLVAMAVKNAREALSLSLRSGESRRAALEELQTALTLPRLPTVIEAYDISNLSGTLAVGSMVTWEEARAKRSQYRRFRITTVAGADDYAMLTEVLRRRFDKRDQWPLPDLILIDGGRGQLSAGLSAAAAAGLRDLPIVSLAKEEELIFHPRRREPLRLPESSRARQLLQQIRDEAHRFAITYHRRLRGTSQLHSILDEVPGVGARRKQILLQRFGSVKRLREATPAQIRRVAGVSTAVAESVHEVVSTLAPL